MTNGEKYRPVNQALGMQPRFGPIPADQLFPWMAIAFTAYLLCQELLKLGWLWTFLIIVWGCSTWWLLTGAKAWKYLSKFIGTPTWTRGRVRYRSFGQYLWETALSSESRSRRTKR